MDPEQAEMLRGGTIAADFYLPCDRPHMRELRYLLWKSGWVRLMDARRACSIGSHQRLIIACVDDHDHRVPKYAIASLFELNASAPKEAESIPPEDVLEGVEDELALGFLVDSDRELTAVLEHRRGQFEAALQQLDVRYQEGARLLQQRRSSLRRLRFTRRDLELLRAEAQVDALHEQLDRAFQAEHSRAVVRGYGARSRT
jgi:hypothetical protein